MVMFVGVDMLVGMGNTVVGVLVGMGVLMLVGMVTAGNMIMVNMHGNSPYLFLSVYWMNTTMSKRFFFQQSVADIADGVQRAEAQHYAIRARQFDGLADTAGDILAGGGYSTGIL